MSEYIEPNDWVVVQNPIKHREISVLASIKFREQQSKADGVFFIDTLLDTGYLMTYGYVISVMTRCQYKMIKGNLCQ